MAFDRVPTGRDVPNEINVVIEIPMNEEPVKYEVDKATGAIFVDRVLTTPMRYPCNYGYVPHTLGGDGDPLDVLVIMPRAADPGLGDPLPPGRHAQHDRRSRRGHEARRGADLEGVSGVPRDRIGTRPAASSRSIASRISSRTTRISRRASG